MPRTEDTHSEQQQRPRRAFGEARPRSDGSLSRARAQTPPIETSVNQPAMANENDHMVVDYDLTHIPILITDWDRHAPSPTTTTSGKFTPPSLSLTPASPLSSTSPSSTALSTAASIATAASEQAQQLTTGFSDVADALWERMTGSMRQKLREACVEVLRRTEDSSEEEKVAWAYGGEGRQWDEDARLLD